MVKHNRQNTLLMEILIVVLFFALCSTVILNVFVGAHNQSERAGAQADALPLFPAGHRHHQVSLVGAADGVAVVPGDLLRLPHYLVRKAAGAVNGQKPLGNVHELPPASLCIQHLHRLLVCSMI